MRSATSCRKWLSLFKSAEQRFDDGSRIRPINRDFYEYSEGDGHVMEVDASLSGLDEPDRILYRDSLRRWKPPFAEEAVTSAKESEILEKLSTYFVSRHTTFKVDEG